MITRVEREVRLIGLQRSGNHALINWILAQARKPQLFFNDVGPEDPLCEERLRSPAMRQNPSGEYELVVYSYEDRLLETVTDPHVYPQRQNRYGHQTGARIDVLILRDPFNTFASREFHTMVPTRRSTYVSGLTGPQLWTTYAREAANQTNLLGDAKVVVNYNQWCRSREYRKQLARQLGLQFTDRGFNEVTVFGGGSSFDATSYSQQAQAMAINERWKQSRHKPEYQSLFSDPLVLKLGTQLFELDEELRVYIDTELTPRTQVSQAWYRAAAVTFLPGIISLARRSKWVQKAYGSFVRPLRQRFIPRSY
ncbi:MAG: hypothetical protein WDZ76_09645 [Pseudohongiellaceae bacterium]